MQSSKMNDRNVKQVLLGVDTSKRVGGQKGRVRGIYDTSILYTWIKILKNMTFK
jgi:hypothetical protein